MKAEKKVITQEKKTALNMLNRNSSYEEVAEVLELPVSTIQSWEAEDCTVV